SVETAPPPLRLRLPAALKFALLLLFSMVWNSVAMAAVSAAVDDWHHGAGSIRISLLASLVFIGLGLIATTAYYAQSLLRPRAEFLFDPDALRPGARTAFSWRMAGRPIGLRRVRITLEGSEVTETQRRVFHSSTLAERQLPEDLDRGRGDIVIPAGAMHSFDAPHNKITWVLRLEAETQGYSGLNNDFALEVRP